jgi:hypothetical protein
MLQRTQKWLCSVLTASWKECCLKARGQRIRSRQLHSRNKTVVPCCSCNMSMTMNLQAQLELAQHIYKQHEVKQCKSDCS